MAMNHRLLRPIASRVSAALAYILATISGENLTDLTGDPLRSIQDA
jgi:hypothetical protein